MSAEASWDDSVRMFRIARKTAQPSGLGGRNAATPGTATPTERVPRKPGVDAGVQLAPAGVTGGRNPGVRQRRRILRSLNPEYRAARSHLSTSKRRGCSAMTRGGKIPPPLTNPQPVNSGRHWSASSRENDHDENDCIGSSRACPHSGGDRNDLCPRLRYLKRPSVRHRTNMAPPSGPTARKSRDMYWLPWSWRMPRPAAASFSTPPKRSVTPCRIGLSASWRVPWRAAWDADPFRRAVVDTSVLPLGPAPGFCGSSPRPAPGGPRSPSSDAPVAPALPDAHPRSPRQYPARAI